MTNGENNFNRVCDENGNWKNLTLKRANTTTKWNSLAGKTVGKHLLSNYLDRARREISSSPSSPNLFPLTNCFFLAENEHPVGKVEAEIAGGQETEPVVLGSSLLF